MVVQPSTSRFVPTLAAARAAGLPLPPGEPIEQEKWSALVVIAAALRRRTWKEWITSHPANLGPIGTKPPPPDDFVPKTQAVLEQLGIQMPCAACLYSPGKRRCRVCNGSGFYRTAGAGRLVPCSCEKGYVPCPTCRGTQVTHHMEVRFFEDTPAVMRELYLPSHLPCYPGLFKLESAMEEAASMEQLPPEELRCHDLTGKIGGSAYRGGSRVERPHFEGHDFGDTIDRALDQLKAFQGGFQIMRYEVRAYAWPLLRLRYEGRVLGTPIEAALFYNRNGVLLMHSDAAS